MDAHEARGCATTEKQTMTTTMRTQFLARLRENVDAWEDTFEPWRPQPGYFRVLLHAYNRLGFDLEPLVTAVGVAS